jgi:hypothetical protein
MAQSSKALGLRIIRILEETFLINGNEVFHGFGAPVANPLAVPPCLRRSGFAQVGLNLSHLAPLLLGSGIPMAICHEKRDAYIAKKED